MFCNLVVPRLKMNSKACRNHNHNHNRQSKQCTPTEDIYKSTKNDSSCSHLPSSDVTLQRAQLMQKIALSLAFVCFFGYLLLSSLPKYSSSSFSIQYWSVSQQHKHDAYHQFSSNGLSSLVDNTISSIPFSKYLNNHSQTIQKRNTLQNVISSIEWEPKDNFKMEVKDGFFIISILSIILVNLLI